MTWRPKPDSVQTAWAKAAESARVGLAVVDLETFFNIFRTGDSVQVVIRDEKESERKHGELFLQAIDWTHDGDTLRFHTWTIGNLASELGQRGIDFSG